MRLAAIYVYMRHKRTKAAIARGEYKGKLQRVVIAAKSSDIQKLKMEVAKAVKAMESRIDYYYVVAAAYRPDKTLAYRVVIKKTMVEG